MEPFTRVAGIAAPLLRANIDTDAISPSHFKPAELSKHGFRDALFLDWRRPNGTTDPDFVLNQERYRQATILMAGPNFGCGSSRETAVWALRDGGFRVVIAPSFALIFETNCIRNGLLPLALPQDIHRQLVDETFTPGSQPRIDIDLLNCQVGAAAGPHHSFRIDPRARDQLLSGLDAIGQTLKHRNDIERFRDQDRQHRPWIYPTPSPKAHI
ncbi:3-isopropylmalate dehydratase small subunit [Mycobacteroides abscessus]|uniref:3-isopropylmalate dehydratase small subunit n=4 Tax=Mycobacteroides abscessus TaxID=36809 RepID=A0A0U1BA76_9MYCO|nr:3-isopropylmalate dehydratase small subunit [Mycobacteroides abscessus]ESV57688.1 3-isopropylmalate dehydratase, small subunit [Mycobacteroides abscessus MAB_082312_2258]AGM31496.1 3-isopropylmalate dehydratase small subunit [Mycobacteroides abscessus subsp. bolletii 50594]AIC70970.1 3-isopropylmalate dehydratase [Mycobacteroides abscessus subsp. massiliense str. GO 06]AMU28468.1 3-isopropylmalate dehydratase [Mycobacteroides abscessus]AMU38095.1 3-isopropylmalate dehydratase [Mycobacteroid